MGLDTTHDCWHGPYSMFSAWRTELAAAIGLSLNQMDGFGGDREWPDDEPLVLLLEHSDCDGEIAADKTELIADRLAEIIYKVKSRAGVGDFVATCQQFERGPREAHNAGEPVGFH